MVNIVMHLDMNSYFASVEQQDHPEFRGKPVGVCEHLGGIIIGASIEAKRWGITTGTPVWEAKRLYPKIVLTHTHAERYRFYTRRFLKVVADYTDQIEKYSIDEVFLDITRMCNIRNPKFEAQNPKQILNSKSKIINLQWVDPFQEAVKIAKEIKARFKKEVGDWLTCSVGIAENKPLAKIASDLKKPNGLVVVNPKSEARNPKQILKSKIQIPEEILVIEKDELYQRLKLTDVPGIGKRQEKNLNELGIKTLKDLRDFPKSHLIIRFGRVMGHHLYNLGQLEGSWKAEVEDDQDIKSMGHMYTLPQQYRKPEFFLPVLYKLCEMVGKRLRRKNLEGNVIHFYFYDKNYQGMGQSKKLGYFLYDGREIFLAAADIYAELLQPLNKRGSATYHHFDFAQGDPECNRTGQRTNPRIISGIKLIGVTVASLRPVVKQLSLFGDVERQRRVVAGLDKINDKYGDFTVCRAPILKAGKAFRDSVGFGRMKEL